MAASAALGPFPDLPGFAEARRRDAEDVLAAFKSRFIATDPEFIYLDGNSLGRLPKATIDEVTEVLTSEWGERLVSSWGDRWWGLARDTGDEIGALIGAPGGSVVVADSTSVSLYKLALAAVRRRPDRKKIVTDSGNFPTDRYVLDAVAATVASCAVVAVDAEDSEDAEAAVLAQIDEDTALVSLSHVSFRSGFLYDMDRITAAAHAVGALVLWDLSHSVGVVPIDISGADLAVGCTYKYLNGGPGSPAFLYVHPDLGVSNPIPGWWGHAAPFAFEPGYDPAPGVGRFQTGTMPILSLSAVGPAVRVISEAGIPAIREKSTALTTFLIELADQMLEPLGFALASPRHPEKRGSHVSLRHPRAWPLVQALIAEAKVQPDFREPDNVRLGLAPLYTSFQDVHTAVGRIASVVRSGALDRYPHERHRVT